MTLVTHYLDAELYGATKGARRATVVVPYNSARRRSPQSIFESVYGGSGNVYSQFLLRYVDGCNSVFICRFWRQPEPLTEDIENSVTPDETNQMITSHPRLGQRPGWRRSRFRKADRLTTVFHSCLRGSSLQLCISITGVVLVLKQQRLAEQVLFFL